MKNAFQREEETRKALAEFVLSANRFSMDEKVREFERAFAAKQGSKEGVMFNSGGSANLAMIQALKNLGRLEDGDMVGFSALTWSTNTMPIIQLGLVPVIVDCDVNTLNTMSYQLERAIQETHMRAYFATNVLGFAGDLSAIRDLCRRKGVILLEDNCEALGTELPEGKTGTFGLAASFSFFVAHHMSTIEGGMACTNDEEYAEMLRIVRANGWDRNLEPYRQEKWRDRFKVESEFHSKYRFYDLAYNLRPTEINGFLGLYQLQFLDESNRAREINYRRLEAVMKENDELQTIATDHLTKIPAFAIPIITTGKEMHEKYHDRFVEACIEIRPMIAGNMQRQPFYKKYVSETRDLPGSDFLHDFSFYCGNHSEFTDEELDTIASCLRKS